MACGGRRDRDPHDHPIRAQPPGTPSRKWTNVPFGRAQMTGWLRAL